MKNILKILIFISIFIYSNIVNALEYTSHIPQSPKKAMIVLHGWQQNGNRIQWLGSKFREQFPDMAFYYPTGPERSPNGGFQWFEIPTLGAQMAETEMYNRMIKSALNNVDELYLLIEEISNDLSIPYENIYISGFSQGGLMALIVGLTSPYKISKVISFSGIPLIETKYLSMSKINNDLKIQIIQGDNDRVIPSDSYYLTQNYLRKLGFNPEVNLIKNLGHHINDRAILSAIDFLR